ncbi:hypothetical protein BRADI_4g03924v3 [Brachypodium distachyon]|uniref:Uncharacterized protein n=1 Tax=Brachypodium distachyon TaxID=15368 RepID=A0A0Q3EET6_BRADI|nr:hypothetical protein BRADI_4g03924v3 [Brachypodium distachyon]
MNAGSSLDLFLLCGRRPSLDDLLERFKFVLVPSEEQQPRPDGGGGRGCSIRRWMRRRGHPRASSPRDSGVLFPDCGEGAQPRV